jgi:hypothetical protein
MSQMVDCRALAARFVASRTVCDPDFAGELALRFGLDAARTLTEIEGADAGDAEDWGDLPQIHALRYVPLERFMPADVGLLVTHLEAPDIILPMARLLLERDPLIEAEHYPGDLLLGAARLVATRAAGGYVVTPVRLPTEAGEIAAVRVLVDLAVDRLWGAFDARAREQGIPRRKAAEARRQISDGPPLTTLDWYYDLDDLMNFIAQARALLEPPTVLKRAYRRTLYSWPAGRRQLHIVAPDDEEQEEQTSRHSFWRDTVYEIVREPDRKGVRLLSRSPSAIEDWRGTAFEGLDQALDFAHECFGIGAADWSSPSGEEALPADHTGLR